MKSATSSTNSEATPSFYPFGMEMPGRSFTAGDYRFGFNGKEQDDEGMGGGGSTYDYGFRIYNPALGKFLSLDPLAPDYPWYTPYQFAGNTPVQAIDLDGLEPVNFKRIMDAQSGNAVYYEYYNIPWQGGMVDAGNLFRNILSKSFVISAEEIQNNYDRIDVNYNFEKGEAVVYLFQKNSDNKYEIRKKTVLNIPKSKQISFMVNSALQFNRVMIDPSKFKSGIYTIQVGDQSFQLQVNFSASGKQEINNFKFTNKTIGGWATDGSEKKAFRVWFTDRNKGVGIGYTYMELVFNSEEQYLDFIKIVESEYGDLVNEVELIDNEQIVPPREKERERNNRKK